jgi:hypothetical protein
METRVTNYGTVFVNQKEYHLDRSLAGETVEINEADLSAVTSKGEFKLSPLPFRLLGSCRHDAKQIPKDALQALLHQEGLKLGDAVRSLAEKENVHPATIFRALHHLRRSQSGGGSEGATQMKGQQGHADIIKAEAKRLNKLIKPEHFYTPGITPGNPKAKGQIEKEYRKIHPDVQDKTGTTVSHETLRQFAKGEYPGDNESLDALL